MQEEVENRTLTLVVSGTKFTGRLVMAFLISPMGLPLAAIWLLGKVQSLKFAIQDWVYG